MMQTKYVGEAI